MAEKVLIVKYGEIAMRGNNKYIFIKKHSYQLILFVFVVTKKLLLHEFTRGCSNFF